MLYSPGAVQISDGHEDTLMVSVKRARLGLDASTDLLTAAVAGVKSASVVVDNRPACTFFMQGRCAYGAKCNFRHANIDAETRNDAKPPCTFFALGRCAKGASCTFSHLEASSAQAERSSGVTLPPCKYFTQGGCFRGDACLYPHVEVQQIEMQIAQNKDVGGELQMFGDEIDQSLESKTEKRSGAEILKKYSTSQRAQEAGFDVRLKARARESLGLQDGNRPDISISTGSTGTKQRPENVGLTDFPPESRTHIIPLNHLSPSAVAVEASNCMKKDEADIISEQGAHDIDILQISAPLSSSTSNLNQDCQEPEFDGLDTESMDQNVLTDPYM